MEARGERLWFWACLAMILSAAAMEAASHPLWLDRLATYSISGAADAQPPFLVFLTRGLRAILGDSVLAVRIQAMLRFGLMLGCLYALERRRSSSSRPPT